MDNQKSGSNQTNETNQNQGKETDDSFRQNASFTEKNLLKESIFSPSNDDHDVRKINREKVEDMIVTTTIQSKEAPLKVNYVGRKGITEWIWKNKVMVDIPSTFLKSYLYKKKKISPMNYYQYYKLVLELSQQVAIFQQIPIDQVSDAEIFNEQTFHFLLESFAQTNRKKQLIKSIYKKAQQTLSSNQAFTIPLSSKSECKLKDRTLHPKVLDFLNQMDKDGKAEGTIRNFIKYMNMFLPWLSDNMLDFKSYEAHEIPTLKIKEMHLSEFRSYLFDARLKSRHRLL